MELDIKAYIALIEEAMHTDAAGHKDVRAAVEKFGGKTDFEAGVLNLRAAKFFLVKGRGRDDVENDSRTAHSYVEAALLIFTELGREKEKAEATLLLSKILEKMGYKLFAFKTEQRAEAMFARLDMLPRY